VSRTGDRQGLDDATWKRLAERDLDEFFRALKDDRDYLESKFREAREWTQTAIQQATEPLRRDVEDLKESNKWQLRTLVGLLISVVLLLGGVVTTLVVH
jgi:hypothetical protein